LPRCKGTYPEAGPTRVHVPPGLRRRPGPSPAGRHFQQDSDVTRERDLRKISRLKGRPTPLASAHRPDPASTEELRREEAPSFTDFPENSPLSLRFFSRTTAIVGQSGVYPRRARCAPVLLGNSVSERKRPATSRERDEGIGREQRKGTEAEPGGTRVGGRKARERSQLS
jgi:hypothetical protein